MHQRFFKVRIRIQEGPVLGGLYGPFPEARRKGLQAGRQLRGEGRTGGQNQSTERRLPQGLQQPAGLAGDQRVTVFGDQRGDGTGPVRFGRPR